MSPVVTPGVGQTVEEVKRTRILNGSEVDPNNPKDSLEYMEALTPEAWTKGEHTVYLYRMEPPIFKGAGPAYVTKYATPINLEQIQRDFGGGIWRIVIKRGDSRITDRQYTISGIPKDLSAAMSAGASTATNGNGGPVAADSNTTKLIDAATNVEAQKAQVDMVKNTAQEMIALARQNAPQQMSVKEILELTKELRADGGGGNLWNNPVIVALLTTLVSKFADRLFADPTANFMQILELAQKFNGARADVVGDWKLAAAQAVPRVAESIADALHEMRMGAEVQAGVRTPQSEVVMRAGQAPNANTQPASGQAAQPAAAGSGNSKVIEMQPPQPQGDPMEAFETKFVELLAGTQVTGAQAAEILWRDWPQIMTEIANYSPEFIIANAFKRPILAPHSGNPRIPQFVGELIAWVKAQQAAPKGA